MVERSFLPRSFQLPDTRLQTRPVLVIASGNAHKVAEIGAMLDAVDLEVLPQPEGVEVEETGNSYLANARLKAEAVARLTGHWALADDSGLEVDALGGAPGLFSARYAPPTTNGSTACSRSWDPAPIAAPVSTAPWCWPIRKARWCWRPRAFAGAKF